ncbi:MAG: T9SS type A sorting domain-containing protein [Crocinitomix sp.]|nr:T9SS type A sorting domain-containing protein [Crocinitomix sp.]
MEFVFILNPYEFKIKWLISTLIKNIVFKSINIKGISILLALFSVVGFAYGQHDFQVSWNAYTTGETIEEDPFNGSFTVSNVGESTINAGDTIWYGYFINDAIYDIALNSDAVSGEVLEEDFEPGGEIVIINNFWWPLFGSGITVEMCAVVYGVGYESYTGEFYTGDDVDSNNTDCVSAILPEYVVGISEENEGADISISFSNQKAFIFNKTLLQEETARLEIYSITGKLLYTELINMNWGTTQIDLPTLNNGIYIGRLISEEVQISEKFVINQ